MATPAKKYQNVSFGELMEYVKMNPNRDQILTPIETQQIIKQIEDTSLDKIGLRGYKAYNLNPSGILSLIMCISDPGSYYISSKSARLQTISTLATELQSKSDNLKNTYLARKRKKIYDLIGAAYNNSKFETKDYLDLYSGIGMIQNIQFILMKSAEQEVSESGEPIESGYKGEIHFSSNPSTWKYDTPTWVADYYGRWVALPLDTTSKPIKSFLANWIGYIEQQGWLIQWPDVDETKVELIEKLCILPTWEEKDRKLTKDVLSQRLGKSNTIHVFTNWMMGKIDLLEHDD